VETKISLVNTTIVYLKIYHKMFDIPKIEFSAFLNDWRTGRKMTNE